LADPEAATPDATTWDAAPYRPTPSIVKAALLLYKNHSDEEVELAAIGAGLPCEEQHLLGLIQDPRLCPQVICFSRIR